MTRSWMMLCLAAAIGCAPTVSKEPPLSSSAATLALFEPDSTDACLSVLPFPTDLAKNPQTGRLDLPFCKTDTPDQLGMKTGLRTLDGYSASVTLTARFSDAINPDTVLNGFKLIEASTGRVVPFTHSFSAASQNTLFIKPQEVLAEYTTYIAVLTGAVTDTSGKPVVSDQVFTFAKSREPLVDAEKYSRFKVLDDASANALEPLRMAYSAVLDKLEASGFKREDIALAWWFTTKTTAKQLVQLGPLLTAHAPAVVHENAIAAKDHALVKAALPEPMRDWLCDVHTGRVELKSLLAASGTFDPALATTTVPVDYILITPNVDPNPTPATLCTTPWPGDKIAVFAHGLGRCKNDVLALANSFAKAGFAVLALDGPRAGARSVVDRGDQDLDGCPDQPATPEFIALPGQNPNPFAIRDHLREWALELAQVAVAAKASPLAFLGQSGTATAKLALVGHSWGGMAAALTSIIPQVPFDAVIANAASADLGGVFAPLLVDPEIIAAFRWAMEAGDPLFAGRVWATTTGVPPMLVQIVAQPGANQPPLHGTDTQRLLATAFGTSVKSSEFMMKDEAGAANAPLCDDPTGVVGALLQPCASSDPGRAQQALGKFMGLQRQVVVFAATAIAGMPPVVCDPNPTVTSTFCP